MGFHCVYDIKDQYKPGAYLDQTKLIVLLNIITRELVSINATLNLNRKWLIQQFCNAEMSGYSLPTAIIADSDGIYGRWLDPTLKDLFGIQVQHIPRKSPWKNGKCERFHLIVKKEILERVDIFDVQHARELGTAYQAHLDMSYRNDASYSHKSLAGQKPNNKIAAIKKNDTPDQFSYEKSSVVGGLVTEFSLAA